ncbi:hypothetical protein FVEN_g12868 [Fusarium venenatum]|nr:hypothetical protein FVEN_g12868 [Fusarium venenatum]
MMAPRLVEPDDDGGEVDGEVEEGRDRDDVGEEWVGVAKVGEVSE